jgi:hypothetical protein
MTFPIMGLRIISTLHCHRSPDETPINTIIIEVIAFDAEFFVLEQFAPAAE